jgi:hypothetical protein
MPIASKLNLRKQRRNAMRRIEIDRHMTTSTPVTDDISGMLAKMGAWKPKSLEHVIMACERIIHAANDDIYYGKSKHGDEEKLAYLNVMKGKLIKYPNGIANSTEYIYVTDVSVDDREWETEVSLNGVRLSKYNRIGNDEIQLYALKIMFSTIIGLEPDGVTIQNHGHNVKYEIVSSFEEYKSAVSRMKAIIPMVQGIPDYLTRDSVKIPLHKSTKKDRQCQTPPTSTTTGKVTLKSCGALSATTSSSQETMGNGKAKSTRQPPVSGTSRKKGSKKSQQNSKSS